MLTDVPTICSGNRPFRTRPTVSALDQIGHLDRIRPPLLRLLMFFVENEVLKATHKTTDDGARQRTDDAASAGMDVRESQSNGPEMRKPKAARRVESRK